MLMMIGARGWEHKQWQGSYYPNEIALDWHLSYYGKDFLTALAPVALWGNCSIEEIKEFCTDVDKEYPLIFEQNEEETDDAVLQLQKTVDEFIPNWIVFKKEGWQIKEDLYHIKQAEILKNTNLGENSAVFSVYSDTLLKDVQLRKLMNFFKKEFKQFDIIYCYFDGELVAIDTLNTAQTLKKMLSLNY